MAINLADLNSEATLDIATAAGVIKVMTWVKAVLGKFNINLTGLPAMLATFVVTFGWRLGELIINHTPGATFDLATILKIVPDAITMATMAIVGYHAAQNGHLGDAVKNLATKPLI
jgi:hypothetical protein